MATQEDVAMTMEPAPKPTTSTATTTTNKPTQQQQHQHQRLTSRNPQWTYFKLQLIPHSHHAIKTFAVDALTARSYLISALSQFLGLMGTSIGVDILKIENPASPLGPEEGRNASQEAGKYPIVWIRVPRDDGAAVLAALSSWVGSLSSSSSSSSASAGAGAGDSEHGDGGGTVAWRICGKGNYLSAIVHGSGEGVFAP